MSGSGSPWLGLGSSVKRRPAKQARLDTEAAGEDEVEVLLVKKKDKENNNNNKVSPASTSTSIMGINNKGGQKRTHLQRLQSALHQQRQKGGDEGDSSPRSEALRRNRAVKMKKQCWVDRNKPGSLEELFVHKKKVEEFQSWLKGTIDDRKVKPLGYRPSKICLMSGPSGSGKTATVFLVAKELGFEIKEWINPMSLTEFRTDRLDKYDPDEVQGKSQFDTFAEFLFRASTYSTLPIKGRTVSKHKLVVVEDFPNFFYRNVDVFHNSILRRFVNDSVFPVVFIMSDSSSRESNPYHLFPKNITQELNICCISLNTIASTYMTKFLSNVCAKEGHPVDKSLLEGVSTSSAGDIRCAVNTLQFKLSGGASPEVFKAPLPKPKGKSTSSKNSTALKALTKDVQKDETLFLFRALGKVLYSKRNSLEDVEQNENNDVADVNVRYLRPNPLEEDPEELVERIEVPADSFLNFLHQNYIPFFGSIDDLELGSSFLANSEFLLSRWPFDDTGTISRSYKDREIREYLSLLIASRGLMYANVKKTRNEWRPLRKPMQTEIKARVDNNLEKAKQLFPHENPSETTFYSDILPLYHKLLQKNPTSQRFPFWSEEHRRFIGEMGKMNHISSQRFQDPLNEKDVLGMSDEEDITETERSEELGVDNEVPVPVATEKNLNENDQQPPSNTASLDDDDFVIEDYSDED